MTQLLQEIFNQDFAALPDPAAFSTAFFAKKLTLGDMKKISAALRAGCISIGGAPIPAATLIKGKNSGKSPFLLLAQLHGNEPAGLAGIALAMALSQAGLLEQDIIGAIGNPLAAAQYFEAWTAHPHERQETRDAFRCGVGKGGALLPDMNRIPVDFLTRDAADHHTLRARELYRLGQHADGILDIHTARGNMLCVTDHRDDSELKDSPIRSVLTGLAEAISAHASASVAVQTFKTILSPLPNIRHQVGIEAGRHEAADSPHHAASFTLSLLHTLGMTRVPPLFKGENGMFDAYAVQPRITYADLACGGTPHADDLVYMARPCHALASVPERSDTVIVKQQDGRYALQSVADFTLKPAGQMEFALYQIDEMEAVEAGQVVAVAVPSGTAFSARSAFSGIFLSKSATLYDKDPNVGPWPVSAGNIASVKFCYPCKVSRVRLG